MAERYTYEDVQFVDADPSRVLPKPKAESKPRVPLPSALTDALRESASSTDDANAVRAVVVPGNEKAAKNLVHRLRTYADKELGGKSVRADVSPHGDVQGNAEPEAYLVTFRVVAKRARKLPEAQGEQLTLEDLATSPEGELTEEAAPPKRSRRSK